MKKNILLASLWLIIGFAIPIIILSYFFGDTNIWDGLRLGAAGTYEEFCERNRMDAFLRERMNSWSNLAFVWFGLICLITGLRKTTTIPSNLIQQSPILSIFTGVSFLYLGIGSFLYHAALTRFTQLLDVAGTYAAMSAIICIGILTVSNPLIKKLNIDKSTWINFAIVLTIIADFLFFRFKWQIDSGIVLPIMIIILLIIALLISLSKQLKGSTLLMIIAFISVGSAYYIWTLDVKKVFCNPDSLLQGHAIWHVLTGTGLFLMYAYFRSVKLVDQ